MAPRNQFPMRGPLASAVEFFAITPSNDADLPQVPRGVWVGGAGNLALVGIEGGSGVILKGIAAGTLVPVSPNRILATGTTATDLVGLV